MFKEFGQIAGLMKNLPKIREDLAELQQKLGQITAEANAGGGMVTVRVNGNKEVVSCDISEEAMAMNDREMLGELFRAATNQALQKVQANAAEEMGKVTAGLGLPPGMDLPGLS